MPAPRPNNLNSIRSAGGPPAPGRRSGRTKIPPAILPLFLLALSVLAALPGCGHRTSLDVAVDFRRAQELFDQAQSPDDYLKAAAIYESIRERGVVSGAVLYNQGNAFMQAGRRGRAIAAYREAIRYRPRDPNLVANLTYAVGKNNVSARRPLVEYIFFWQNWLGYGEKFTLAATAALLTFTLAVLALWLPPRRLWMWSALAGTIVTMVLIASAAYDWYRFERIEHGVVIAPEVVARKGNADNYEPAFADPLPEGTEFTVAERRNDWLLIQLEGNQEGWLETRQVVVY